MVSLAPDPDAEVFAGLEDLRCAIHEDPGAARRALRILELRIRTRLAELKRQSTAVADANVRAVEILERHEALTTELKEQKLELAEQNRRISSKLTELEIQSRALAAANVDAVMLIEATGQAAENMQQTQNHLAKTNASLAEQAKLLEMEARALAQANVEAVRLLEEQEAAMSALSRHAQNIEEEKLTLAERVFVDELTGLYNHRFLRDQLHAEIARARRHHRPLSILFIDADHFKHLNDTNGHEIGNVVLRKIAEVLASEVRQSDMAVRIEGSARAIRYGGEEFVLVLPETPMAGALAAGERLRAHVAETDFPGGSTQPGGRVTISVGAASLLPEDTLDTFIARADAALYDAKRAGRNRVAAAKDPVASSSIRTAR